MTKTQCTPGQTLSRAVYRFAVGSQFDYDLELTAFFRAGGTAERADEIIDRAYDRAALR